MTQPWFYDQATKADEHPDAYEPDEHYYEPCQSCHQMSTEAVDGSGDHIRWHCHLCGFEEVERFEVWTPTAEDLAELPY